MTADGRFSLDDMETLLDKGSFAGLDPREALDAISSVVYDPVADDGSPLPMGVEGELVEKGLLERYADDTAQGLAAAAEQTAGMRGAQAEEDLGAALAGGPQLADYLAAREAEALGDSSMMQALYSRMLERM